MKTVCQDCRTFCQELETFRGTWYVLILGTYPSNQKPLEEPFHSFIYFKIVIDREDIPNEHTGSYLRYKQHVQQNVLALLSTPNSSLLWFQHFFFHSFSPSFHFSLLDSLPKSHFTGIYITRCLKSFELPRFCNCICIDYMFRLSLYLQLRLQSQHFKAESSSAGSSWR